MQTRTTSGVVRGRPEGALAVFRGIPFAQPPTGRLRFAAPRTATARDGVREASAFGSPPPQSSVLAPAPGPAASPANRGLLDQVAALEWALDLLLRMVP